VGTNDGKGKIGGGRSSGRAKSPSQVKVKQEMVAKAHRQLELTGNVWLIRDLALELKKPASLSTGLRSPPMSK
jgi:hypothetical protein